MSKPVIFTISAVWDQTAKAWTGHCDEIPAAADAPTLDELLARISEMALDLLADNHPDVDPATVYFRLPRCAKRNPRRPDGPAIRSGLTELPARRRLLFGSTR